MGKEPIVSAKVTCAHCGDRCPDASQKTGDLHFCCQGCASVYEILHANNLGDFYRMDADAGRAQRQLHPRDYSWLDLDKLAGKLIRYRDETQCHVEMELPSIHCASCVWLLERLPQLEAGIRSSQVDVTRKQAVINFDPRQTTLRQVAELLTRIGYPPHFQSHRDGAGEKQANRSLIYRIGVAGFCFGNVMLLSFPEYFGLGEDAGAVGVEGAMGYLLLALSLPVMFYAGTGFFTAAWAGLKARRVTIDVPIAVGMIALFARSVYEILSGTGAGYMDSLAGLVFFLLIGRWFQSYTFARMNFDRDYRDYFPVAAHRLLADGGSEPVASEDLVVGDRILVWPGQLIPTDGTLLEAAAAGIDYSFVTGEADPRPASAKQEVFAGGRATTAALTMMVSKAVSQSYLLQLWRRGAERVNDADVQPAEGLIRYFTAGILLLAALTFAWWRFTDPAVAYRAATAVLIIACPCALALAAPFAYGSLQRLFGKAGCYLRGPGVITRMAEVDAFVFDKTGTLVGELAEAAITWLDGEGSHIVTDSESLGEKTPGVLNSPPLWDRRRQTRSARLRGGFVERSQENQEQLAIFRAMAERSSHPKSRALARALAGEVPAVELSATVTETTAAGLQYQQDDHDYRIGKASFCGLGDDDGRTYACLDSQAMLALDPATTNLRPGAADLLASLRKRGPVYLLSGDQAPGTDYWSAHLEAENVHFTMSPFDKQDFVDRLRSEGRKVLMVGDGLNDAGALSAADVGLAISDEEARFSPACDGILTGSRIAALESLLCTSGRARMVLWTTYIIALCYNLIGLTFAVTGTLSPVVAAILMPLSSITVVVVATLGARLINAKSTASSPSLHEHH